jgi:hypothetical protein
VREGLAASEETSPGFVGPLLYGLLALIETERSAREAALAAGEALLAKGAGGHNHFWFRRYAIEAALQAGEWDAADTHADALARRTAAERLPYSDLIVERGRILARKGRGTARDEGVGRPLRQSRRRLAHRRSEGRAAGGVKRSVESRDRCRLLRQGQTAAEGLELPLWWARVI